MSAIKLVSKEEWQQAFSAYDLEGIPFKYMKDYGAANYLEPIITGYMDSPVVFNGVSGLEAKTRCVDNLYNFMCRLKENGHTILLYQIYYVPTFPIYHKMTENFGENIPLEEPVIINGIGGDTPWWKIRYVALDKDGNEVK